ncbi:hypothetical protein E4T66_15375 [Sinimarinibacterium sp. CAU 1509]|uniref:hypothetical protein n=1 Tax=Sinimarinibacterium sp. CAU 1509 TaxID=2562283 RepID=UPI0010AD57FB|nr:hypothetical protein [Sinimarinibacterium sp. CAU 1509]TJY58971.1 hypothetical protein E4T66_15375 [Sinimarinibacterium sp. CAU 1509]
MTLAIAVFVLVTAGLARLEHRLHQHHHEPLQHWWIEQGLLPLGRVFALMLLIGLGYPDIFGIDDAPSLRALLQAEPGRFDQWINILFIVGLLLPALPLLHRLPGLALPLQGLAGVAVVFSWLRSALNIDATLIPPRAEMVLLLLLAALASAAAKLLSLSVREPVLRQDLRDLVLLWLQAPLVIVYARMLGNALRP